MGGRVGKAWAWEAQDDMETADREGLQRHTGFDIQVDGKRGPGRPKTTWKQLTGRDCREWKLSDINPHDRRTWRSGVRSAMRAASQLSGRGAH